MEAKNNQVSEEDIAAVMKMLEDFGNSEEGRFKVVTSDEMEAGESKKQYHLGRCDVGSPWAKGTPFDVLEEGQIEDVTEVHKGIRHAGNAGCE